MADMILDELPGLIAFLRRVPLPDGRLVVHHDEIALRQNQSVVAP